MHAPFAGVLRIDMPREAAGAPRKAAQSEIEPLPSGEAAEALQRDRGGEASTSGRLVDETPQGRGVSLTRDGARPQQVSGFRPRVQSPEKIDVLRGIDAPLPGGDPLDDGGL